MARYAGGWLLLAALGSFGCNDVTRFSTGPDESYCGSIIPGGFVRKGFAPGVRMRMSFDADRMADLPGVISTDDGTFVDSPMRPIPQLANDPLSTLQFGEGRQRNLLTVLGADDGQTVFAVISLMEHGDVEVRIMRGAPPPPGVTARPTQEGRDLFGVFPLARQRGTCGF